MPALRLENAVSLGARMVMPLFVFPSWEFKLLSNWVVFKRRIKVLNWPDFLRILMTLVGPGGVGARAGDWARVFVQWNKRMKSDNEKRDCGLIFVVFWGMVRHYVSVCKNVIARLFFGCLIYEYGKGKCFIMVGRGCS